MAKVQVLQVLVNNQTVQNRVLPIPTTQIVGLPDPVLVSSGSASPASTFQSTYISPFTLPSNYAYRVAVDGQTGIHITFGTNPVATTLSGFLCTPGVHEFSVTAFGEKYSIIDA